jgi:hypothetical protein
MIDWVLMSKESQPTPVTAIHLDLKARSLTVEAADEPVAKFTLAGHGLIFEDPRAAAPRLPSAVEATGEAQSLPVQEVATPEAAESAERESTVVVSGRLRSAPKAGKVDRRGKPTAWARFAAHEEERDQAHMYLATFHRHTAEIALSLRRGAALTVQGYPHPSHDPQKMDTFSVINLVDYPDKPPKAA